MRFGGSFQQRRNSEFEGYQTFSWSQDKWAWQLTGTCEHVKRSSNSSQKSTSKCTVKEYYYIRYLKKLILVGGVYNGVLYNDERL